MEYGLIGEHLGHSFSKIIHEKLASYQYEIKEIARCDLEKFFKEKNFKAINVTIPYKEIIIPYLDEISPQARAIGAVNTVINKNGKLYGYNTDYWGLRALINNNHIDFKDKKVLILGSGGTSKTAYAVASDLGAKEILKVYREGDAGDISYDEAKTVHSDCAIIINTTPVGMFPNVDNYLLDPSSFKKLEAVIDVVYNPLKTIFVKKALDLHLKACNGLYMLVAQAFYACQYFLDQKLDIKLIDKIYQELFLEKANVVLIGMPTSGKTTVGKVIAEKLNKTFVDLDDEIVKVIGTDISTYFKNHTEDEFRTTEMEVVSKFAKMNNLVIATGGGVILRNQNIVRLKQNGLIFFLNRPLSILLVASDRPLSSSKDALEKRFKERFSLYQASCDVEIDASLNVIEVADLVIRRFLNEDFSH